MSCTVDRLLITCLTLQIEVSTTLTQKPLPRRISERHNFGSDLKSITLIFFIPLRVFYVHFSILRGCKSLRTEDYMHFFLSCRLHAYAPDFTTPEMRGKYFVQHYSGVHQLSKFLFILSYREIFISLDQIQFVVSVSSILLCSQSFWLLTQGPRVRFQALPDFLSSSGSGTRSTQPLWE
jgi:hypothetical protein